MGSKENGSAQSITDTDPWIDVSLNGVDLSVEESTLRPGEEGPLAPRSHIVGGELSIASGLGSDSYAHVLEDGTIKRYREVIGKREDIVRDATVEDHRDE